MRQSLTIGVLAASDIAVSFAMQVVIVATIGLGWRLDALYACMVVPALVLGIVQSSIMHVLVPLLTNSHDETLRSDGWALFLIIGSILMVLAMVLGITAPLWVRVIVPGFSVFGKELVVNLTRIQISTTVFIAEISVLTSIFHARNRFIWPEWAPLIGDSIGLALLIWALPRYGVFSVVWLNVASVVIQALLLIPILGSFARPNIANDNLKLAWLRIRPLLFGACYYKTDAVLDRALSSMTRSGGFSILYIGQQIYLAANQIICKALCAPIFPKMSDYAANENWVALRQLCLRGLARVTGLTVVAFALFLLFGERVLKLAVGHSHLTADNVHALWVLMVLSAGVLIGGPIGQILSTTLYSTGDTKSPTRLGAVSYTFGIVMKVALFHWFGLRGIAAGISLYFALSAVLMAARIHKSVPRTAIGALGSVS